MALDDLRTADWSDIKSGVYGRPEDVLAQLQALVYDTESTAVTVDSLCGEIYHQGDVYVTTARAIPYLIDLIRSESESHRALHAALLAWMAILYGGGGTDYNRSTSVADHPERDNADASITAAVEQAVRLGLPVYLERLNDLRAEVHNGACLVLGCLTQDSGSIVQQIHERLDRATDPIQRAALLLCYSRLISYPQRRATLMATFKDAKSPPIVRLISAMVLGETEETGLFTAISSVPGDEQASMPRAVRAYLKKRRDDYGNPTYQILEQEFAAAVCGLEVLDVVLETLLDEQMDT